MWKKIAGGSLALLLLLNMLGFALGYISVLLFWVILITVIIINYFFFWFEGR